jgi:CheY-like chemotaxis protein
MHPASIRGALLGDKLVVNGIKRVLIVDDDSDNRKVVAACLRALGEMIVDEAHDGLAALKSVLEHEPDLIVLDMDMPYLDGYRAARMIRVCSPRAATVPILALTAAIERDAHARCLHAGASDYVPKPLADLPALRAKIGTLLALAPHEVPPSAAHPAR